VRPAASVAGPFSDPERLVTAARALLGVRWRHEGRSLNGLDCVGLLICAGRAVGLLPTGFDVRGYPRRPRDHTLIKRLAEFCDRVPVAAMAMGDAVAFVGSERLPCHVGLVSRRGGARPGLIHASEEIGRVVEHDLESGRLVGCWRPRWPSASRRDRAGEWPA